MRNAAKTGNSLHVYWRLLGYTKPYRLRLAVGILAGILVGGSLFASLRMSPAVIGLLAPSPVAAASAAAPVAVPAAPDSPPAAVPAVEPKRDPLASVKKWAGHLGIEVTRPDGSMTAPFLLILMFAIPFCFLLKACGSYLNNYCVRWVGAHVIVDIRNKLFDRLLGQSLGYFGKTDVGSLISRCTNDTAQIESAISQTVADLIQSPMEIAAAATFIVLTTIEYKLFSVAGALFLIFPLIILPVIILGRRVKRYARRSLERVSDLVSRMQEVFSGIRAVKAYHTETFENERFTTSSRTYFRTVVSTMRYELLMTPLMEVVAVTSACAFLVYCYHLRIGFDIIVPVGAAAMMAYRPIKMLARVNNNLQRSAAAAERIFAILDTDTALKEKPDAVPLEAFRDRIVFDNVCFAYNPGGLPVLSDIKLDIPRGTVTAVVGLTGSGKSTMAWLLARFYDPVSGRILMDGHDLRDLRIASIRRLVGVVTQETILFNDTIASNIAYGTPGATREQIMEAAKKANAHDFIMEQPEGYGRVAGDKGCNLSGGQRQRIAIARAILRNPPILILDEATSALDSVTEKLVQEALYRLMEERTVFVIAHRLSTIQHAHQICVLEQGRIVERGTHAELLAMNGDYHRLCESAQFGVEPAPASAAG